MSRILLIISLIFSLSFLPNTGNLYATCGTCGIPAPGESGAKSHRGGGGGEATAAAAFAIFGALMAAKSQEDAVSEDEKLDRLAAELALAFKTIDPTKKHHKEEK